MCNRTYTIERTPYIPDMAVGDTSHTRKHLSVPTTAMIFLATPHMISPLPFSPPRLPDLNRYSLQFRQHSVLAESWTSTAVASTPVGL